ncbi:MAG: UDP-N-acetylmuramate dehydrogenase [Microgenomates group bacterium Gr01-1014_93]|nr:MAG: UDP-N-acetylmuramate dehydrogenase [Microgenomates group bacterium Gr01-1014_93]
MDDKYKLILNSFGTELIKLDEPLKFHTALKIGGSVKLFFIATRISEIEKMVTAALDLKLPFIIFGTGSKLMVSDLGFDGIVIKNRSQNIKIVSIKGMVGKGSIGVSEVMVEVDSGVTMKALVDFLEKQNLESADIKDLPGSIGGNIFINKILQDKSEIINVLEDGDSLKLKPSQLLLRKHIILSIVLKFKSK